MLANDMQTLEERYSCATNSSHLEVKEGRCDVDVLIAAGWSGDRLGTMLYRLASEHDSARGEAAVAFRQAELRSAQIKIAVASKDISDEDKAKLRAEADREALTNRLLVLMKLKSLASTKQALGEWAVIEAAKQRFMPVGDMPLDVMRVKAWRVAADSRMKAINAIVGRVLDAWLDPLCYKCDGRGFKGGYGSPRLKCTACHSSGRRVNAIPANSEQAAFVGHLAAEMEQKISGAERSMRRFLRNGSLDN